MPTAENAKLEYESGQDIVSMRRLFDSGDRLTFNSPHAIWSNRSSYQPDVKPNGLATGGVISAASGLNRVAIAAGTAYIAGSLVTFSAVASRLCYRGVGADVCRINSICVTAGAQVVTIAGTDGTAFSETRAAAGGPPLIPTTYVEIGQVRYSSITDAATAATDIKQVPGTHQERYDFPTWDINYINVAGRILGAAGVTFHSALPQIHTGTLPKFVYAQYYTPTFAQVPKASAFVPAETSHSATSTQIYGLTIAAASTALGQGSFTAFLTDGISDGLLGMKDEEIWFRFYQNRLNTPYILTRGKFGITRAFPAGDNISAACTITPEEAAEEVVSATTLVASTTTTTTSTSSTTTTTTTAA